MVSQNKAWQWVKRFIMFLSPLISYYRIEEWNLHLLRYSSMTVSVGFHPQRRRRKRCHSGIWSEQPMQHLVDPIKFRVVAFQFWTNLTKHELNYNFERMNKFNLKTMCHTNRWTQYSIWTWSCHSLIPTSCLRSRSRPYLVVTGYYHYCSAVLTRVLRPSRKQNLSSKW